MSKRTKRQQRSQTAFSSTPVVTTSAPSSLGSSRSTDFHPDYAYVKKDLRRIGTLAGSFLVILIALSFILPLVIH